MIPVAEPRPGNWDLLQIARKEPARVEEDLRCHAGRRRTLLSSGSGVQRQGGNGGKILHARILLKGHVGPEGKGWKDDEIAEGFDVTGRTVQRGRPQKSVAGAYCEEPSPMAGHLGRARQEPQVVRMTGLRRTPPRPPSTATTTSPTSGRTDILISAAALPESPRGSGYRIGLPRRRPEHRDTALDRPGLPSRPGPSR